MDIYTATEEAYKNGYTRGAQDAVVHCRDCKYYSAICTCNAKNGLRMPTDNSFCSYGERVIENCKV